jgi:hypothetical protein
MEQLKMINPTIATSGNWLKNRQYHTMYTDANNVAEPTPVYAPADAVATEITHYLARCSPSAVKRMSPHSSTYGFRRHAM